MDEKTARALLAETEVKKRVRLERYAEILAHLLHFRGEDAYEVVRRLGVSPEDWTAADRAWTTELELAPRRGQRDLALRFVATLAHARAKLTAQQPSFASIQRAPVAAAAPAPPPEPASPPPEPAAPLAPSALPMPAWHSEVTAQPAVIAPLTPQVAVAPPALDATADVSAFRPPKPLPFANPAPPAALDETADVTSLKPRVALPFIKPATPAAPEPTSPPAEAVAKGQEAAASPAPPKGPADSHLTVAQYAAACVHLDREPQRQDEILRTYRLDAAQHARWRESLAADPELRRAWEDAYRTYQEWLARR